MKACASTCAGPYGVIGMADENGEIDHEGPLVEILSFHTKPEVSLVIVGPYKSGSGSAEALPRNWTA